jgi:hypothetical protein
MDIQDNMTPADNRDDLVRRIVAVCEQIPPRQWKVSNVL